MDYAGFYINLDRSPQRRAEMEAMLAHHGLQAAYPRFRASDGNELNFPNPALKDGEMGCFTSHYRLMKENLGRDSPLHVVEDDVVFAGCMADTIKSVIENGVLANYDIVYTDTWVPTSNGYFRTYKSLLDKAVVRNEEGRVTQATFSVIDMRDRPFATTASYLVNPQSIAKLHDLYAAELTNGPAQPIDFFIRRQAMQGVLRIGCLFPFVTSIRFGLDLNTTIDGRDMEWLPALASNIARASFFVDSDLSAYYKYVREVLPLPHDTHSQILMHLLGFYFTPYYDGI